MSDQPSPQPTQTEAERKKRPASQYYWGDWWKDKGLHSCSLTARGLWHEMNCLMHEGEPYGHLTLNGRPMTVAQLANQCRISASQCAKLLRELEDAGVPSRTPEGVIYSRRMVRDEAARNARAEGGKLGAEHGSKGAEHGPKGGRPAGSKGGSETPLDGGKKPPPSSSSSSSTSVGEPPSDDGGGAEPPAPPPPPAPPKAEQPDLLPGLPDCPHEAIIAAFHEALPMARHVRDWTPARAQVLRARWREDRKRQTLDWWRRFFAYCAASPFLTGRSSTPGRRPFELSLDWLVKAENFAKVREGAYHEAAAAPAPAPAQGEPA